MSDHAEKVRRGLQHALDQMDGQQEFYFGNFQRDGLSALNALVAERDGLRARVEQLETALRRYGGHDYMCAQGERTAHGGGVPGDCDCGFSVALSGLGDA